MKKEITKEEVYKMVERLIESAEQEDLIYWSKEYLTKYYLNHLEDAKEQINFFKGMNKN